MASITLEYDGRKPCLKKLIEDLIALGAKPVDAKHTRRCGLDEALEDVKKGTANSPNATTINAIKELRKGNVTRCKTFNDYSREVK